MADIERLHFKIGLSGTYWSKKPIYSISVDDSLLFTKEIETASDEVVFIEFDADIAEGSHSLKIRLENKNASDTVENDDKTAIVNDMLLNIKSVEIDEIDLGQLIWTASTFVGDDADRPELKNCVNLGWNGTWSLPFESPFYIWLLENI
jgi:hypothetical protein